MGANKYAAKCMGEILPEFLLNARKNSYKPNNETANKASRNHHPPKISKTSTNMAIIIPVNTRCTLPPYTLAPKRRSTFAYQSKAFANSLAVKSGQSVSVA